MATVTRFCKKLTEKDKVKALNTLRKRLSDKEITEMYPDLFKKGTCYENQRDCGTKVIASS